MTVTEIITMALPGVIADGERRDLLHEAALAYIDAEEGSEASLTVMRYASGSLCARHLEDACRDYARAVDTRDDLARDARCWRDHYADLDEADPETAARHLAADDVADAMNVLMAGRCAR